MELLGQEGLGRFPSEPCLVFLRTLCLCPDCVLRFLALEGLQRIRSRELERSRDMGSSLAFLQYLHN